MKTVQHRKLILRLGVFSTGLFAMLLCFSPVITLMGVVYAQPAPASAPAVTPATTPAPAAATVPATPVKVEPTKTEPAAAPAPAVETEKTQAWWQAMLLPVLSVLGLFIAAFLTAGLRKLVQLIERKWNIDIPDSVETLMTDKARWALAWAEEQAEKRLLYGDGKKTSGAEKMTSVIELLEKFAQGLGYGEAWQRDKIEKLAEGVLHLERSPGIGSDGARADALVAKANGNG